MSVATRKGDNGQTTLMDRRPISKNNGIFEAIGNVDELNCHVGIVRNQVLPSNTICTQSRLKSIQHNLFQIGAELACPNMPEMVLGAKNDDPVGKLDEWLKETESAVSSLNYFILPGGTMLGSHLHLARAVARRAERSVIDYGSMCSIKFLNRLSDLLFQWARYCNGCEEIRFKST